MSELFEAYSQLIRDAESVMIQSPAKLHQELYDIVEELVYMRFRLGECNDSSK